VWFHGVSEYLEVLAAYIEAPRLDYFEISFVNQLVFDIPQIVRFIGHSEWVRQSYLSLEFDPTYASIAFVPNSHKISRTGSFPSWKMLCEGLDWQVFSISQICNQILPFRSSVEGLGIWYRDRRDKNLNRSEIDQMTWIPRYGSTFFTLFLLCRVWTYLPSWSCLLQLRCKDSSENRLPKFFLRYTTFLLVVIFQTKLPNRT
jgi:hypothetical protein